MLQSKEQLLSLFILSFIFFNILIVNINIVQAAPQNITKTKEFGKGSVNYTNKTITFFTNGTIDFGESFRQNIVTLFNGLTITDQKWGVLVQFISPALTLDAYYDFRPDNKIKITYNGTSTVNIVFKIEFQSKLTTTTNYVENRYEIGDLCYDWSDYPVAVFNEVSKNLSFQISTGKFSIDPIVAGVSTSNSALAYTIQRKSFYAQSIHWLFFYDNATGYSGKITYMMSINAIDWYNKTTLTTTVSTTQGYMFSVDTNGTHVAYAQCSGALGADLYFRQGAIFGNGTIVWTTEVVAKLFNNTVDNKEYGTYPTICYSGNNVWISCGYRDTVGLAYGNFVTRNSNTDGTWSTTTNFPVYPFVGGTVAHNTAIVSTSSNNASLITYNSDSAYLGEYNINSTGTVGTLTQFANESIASSVDFSVVANGAKVYVAWLNVTVSAAIRIANKTSSTAWGAAITLTTGVNVTLGNYSVPVLCVDSLTGDLYCFFGYNSQTSFYAQFFSMQYYYSYSVWGSPTLMFTYSSTYSYQLITTYYTSSGCNSVTLFYLTFGGVGGYSLYCQSFVITAKTLSPFPENFEDFYTDWTPYNNFLGLPWLNRSSAQVCNGSYSGLVYSVGLSSLAYISGSYTRSAAADHHSQIYFYIDSSYTTVKQFALLVLYDTIQSKTAEEACANYSGGVWSMINYNGAAFEIVCTISTDTWVRLDAYYNYTSGNIHYYINNVKQGGDWSSYNGAGIRPNTVQIGDFSASNNLCNGFVYLDSLTVDTASESVATTYTVDLTNSSSLSLSALIQSSFSLISTDTVSLSLTNLIGSIFQVTTTDSVAFAAVLVINRVCIILLSFGSSTGLSALIQSMFNVVASQTQGISLNTLLNAIFNVGSSFTTSSIYSVIVDLISGVVSFIHTIPFKIIVGMVFGSMFMVVFVRRKKKQQTL